MESRIGFKRSRFLLLFCAINALGFSLPAQKLIYRVEYNNDSVGYVMAERTSVGNKTVYNLNTESNFSFLIRVKHKASYTASFNRGVLTTAISKYSINDKERSRTNVTYKNGEYIISNDGKTYSYATPIQQSIASLYFNEPQNAKIFSERHGDFCSIERIDQQTYKLIQPDDRANIYHFKNGLCEKVEIQMPLATIHLQKIN